MVSIDGRPGLVYTRHADITSRIWAPAPVVVVYSWLQNDLLPRAGPVFFWSVVGAHGLVVTRGGAICGQRFLFKNEN